MRGMRKIQQKLAPDSHVKLAHVVDGSVGHCVYPALHFDREESRPSPTTVQWTTHPGIPHRPYYRPIAENRHTVRTKHALGR